MTIQTLSYQLPAAIGSLHVLARTADPRVIVAPEGSALASRLRSSGWIARSGWRSHAAGRPPVWLVRFESPTGSTLEAVA